MHHVIVDICVCLQLERERSDLRVQVSMLKQRAETVEGELSARTSAMVQNAEETAQQRAESGALR